MSDERAQPLPRRCPPDRPVPCTRPLLPALACCALLLTAPLEAASQTPARAAQDSAQAVLGTLEAQLSPTPDPASISPTSPQSSEGAQPITQDPDPLGVGALRALAAPGNAPQIPPEPCPEFAPTDGRPVSLEELVAIGLCRRPDVQAAWAELRGQWASLGIARAAGQPRANLSLTQQRSWNSNDVSSYAVSGATGNLGLSWRIFDFGTRAAESLAAQQQFDAALASRNAALQQVVLEIVSAFFAVQNAAAQLDERKQATRLADDTLASTRRREARGVAATADSILAQATLGKAQLAEERAAADLARAQVDLAGTIGLPDISPLSLAPTTPPDRNQALAALDTWIQQAKTHHPALLAARARLNASRAKAESARTQGRPTIDLVGNYYRNGYPNQALQPGKSTVQMLGLQLNVPLFEGHERTYRITAAEAEVDRNQAQLRDTETRLLARIALDYADAHSSLRGLNASERWIRSAQDALASAQRRYQLGVSDIIELLAAQNNIIEARQERARLASEWSSVRLRMLVNSVTFNQNNSQSQNPSEGAGR